jgi:hypothetical protein
MVVCPARQPEDRRVGKILAVRQVREVRPEMPVEADSRVRVELRSDKLDKMDKEDKPEARRAVAAIKSPPVMTALIPFPM